MKQRLKDRNEQIRQDFEQLYDKGMLRLEACLKRLSEKHFLSENTIFQIVKRYGATINEAAPRIQLSRPEVGRLVWR